MVRSLRHPQLDIYREACGELDYKNIRGLAYAPSVAIVNVECWLMIISFNVVTQPFCSSYVYNR